MSPRGVVKRWLDTMSNYLLLFFKTMLTALLLIPLVGAFALLPIAEGTEAGDSRMKRIALVTSMVNFFVSIVLWGEFDSSASQFQFVQEFNNLSFCHFHIGIDGISL